MQLRQANKCLNQIEITYLIGLEINREKSHTRAQSPHFYFYSRITSKFWLKLSECEINCRLLSIGNWTNLRHISIGSNIANEALKRIS